MQPTNLDERLEFYFDRLTNGSGSNIKWHELLADFSSESEGRIKSALRHLTVSQLASISDGINAVREEVKENTLHKLKLEAMRLGLSNEAVLAYFSGDPLTDSTPSSPKKKPKRTAKKRGSVNARTTLALPRSFIFYVCALKPDLAAAELNEVITNAGVAVKMQSIYQVQHEVRGGWLEKRPDFVSRFEERFPHLILNKPEPLDFVLNPDPIDDSQEELEAEEDGQLKYLGVENE